MNRIKELKKALEIVRKVNVSLEWNESSMSDSEETIQDTLNNIEEDIKDLLFDHCYKLL